MVLPGCGWVDYSETDEGEMKVEEDHRTVRRLGLSANSSCGHSLSLQSRTQPPALIHPHVSGV